MLINSVRKKFQRIINMQNVFRFLWNGSQHYSMIRNLIPDFSRERDSRWLDNQSLQKKLEADLWWFIFFKTWEGKKETWHINIKNTQVFTVFPLIEYPFWRWLKNKMAGHSIRGIVFLTSYICLLIMSAVLIYPGSQERFIYTSVLSELKIWPEPERKNLGTSGLPEPELPAKHLCTPIQSGLPFYLL